MGRARGQTIEEGGVCMCVCVIEGEKVLEE